MKSVLALSLLRYLTKYFVKYGNYCLFFPTRISLLHYMLYIEEYLSLKMSLEC